MGNERGRGHSKSYRLQIQSRDRVGDTRPVVWTRDAWNGIEAEWMRNGGYKPLITVLIWWTDKLDG